MRELIVPVTLDQIDQVHAFVDAELTRQGCPTVLRIRTEMLVEELFSAAIDHLKGGSGTFVCTADPQPGSFSFRFRSPQGPFSPDYTGLKGLLGRQCTYGLTAVPQGSDCTITVGQRTS